jgi:hypothetical protein
MEMEKLTLSHFCILDTQQNLPETPQSIAKSVSTVDHKCLFSTDALFWKTSHVIVPAPLGSHKWSLFTGPWKSADGVTVNLYNISPALWGQSGSQIGRIGVITHELGHFMGAPDMYDTDGGKNRQSTWLKQLHVPQN